MVDGKDDTRKNVLSKTIFVQLHIIENNFHHDFFHMIDSYPTIFISKAVFYSLELRTNSKVKLDFVQNEEKFELTQLDFTVIKSEVSFSYL